MPPPASQPPHLPLRAGDFHRLGIVSALPAAQVSQWFVQVLGAAPYHGGMAPVHGYRWPHGEPSGSAHDSQATADMLWLGNAPVALFTATDEGSEVAHFLRRYGPGPHSLAWTLDDMWTAESLLRRHGVRITGTDTPGRHFFMHPRDSAGVLIEWTDMFLAEDPRDGGPVERHSSSLVDVQAIAWVTALVRDVTASARILQSIVDARIVEGNPRGPSEEEDTLDLAIGDMVLRLVAPRSSRSPHAAALEQGGERLRSICLGVPDLDSAIAALTESGVDVVARAASRAWSDPAQTLGLAFEWTDRYVVPQHAP